MSASLQSGDALLDRQAGYLHWLLRTPLALVMLYHGILQGLQRSVLVAENPGLPGSIAALVVGLQILSGALLLLGAWLGTWLTRLGAAMALPVLLGAIFIVHWGQWIFLPSATHPLGGLEFQFTLACLAIYLLVRGNEV